VLKCVGKRVVCVAGGGVLAGIALAKGLKMVLLQSASLNTYAGLTLSVDRRAVMVVLVHECG
jgi:hypoxanthine phosphoribosyltransferase